MNPSFVTDPPDTHTLALSAASKPSMRRSVAPDRHSSLPLQVPLSVALPILSIEPLTSTAMSVWPGPSNSACTRSESSVTGPSDSAPKYAASTTPLTPVASLRTLPRSSEIVTSSSTLGSGDHGWFSCRPTNRSPPAFQPPHTSVDSVDPPRSMAI